MGIWVRKRKCHAPTDLSGVLPRDAGEGLDGEGSEGAEHGPAAMDHLTLPEPLQPENLAVRLERSRLQVAGLPPHPDHLTCHVLGQVLVQAVEVELQVLRRLPKPEGIEPTVPYHRPIQPLRWLRSWEPHEPLQVCRLLGRSFRWWRWFPFSEPEPRLETPAARHWAADAGPKEVWRCGHSGLGAGGISGVWPGNSRQQIVDWI